MSGKSGNSRYSNRILLTSCLAGMVPLLLIFSICLFNPDSSFLNTVYNSTQGIPSVTSAFNPLMTRVMDIYCKSAPFFATLIFFVLFRHREIKIIPDKEKLITACIFSPFVYAFYVYFILWHNLELTTAGMPVRLMAESNVLLLMLYTGLYAATFFMTYGICYLPVLASELLKERLSR
ncbi:colicin immunity protein Cui [Citrobacter koseri]|uniref:colicin immunity protein Cui n=1 Tax=Citrobacter koseri TaxID=545 RepID=UPI003D01508D